MSKSLLKVSGAAIAANMHSHQRANVRWHIVMYVTWRKVYFGRVCMIRLKKVDRGERGLGKMGGGKNYLGWGISVQGGMRKTHS